MGREGRAAAALRRRASSRSRACPVDAGFSLVELIVAIGMVGVVMAALGSFYVSGVAAGNSQSDRQAAIQVALDAMEQVRATDASQLLVGRSNGATNTQWANAPAGVTAHLATMTRAWSNASGTAKLPTTPQSVTVSGVEYQKNWYVGTCWQAVANDATCGPTESAGMLQLYQVVVAVTWKEKSCPSGDCSYVASTLVGPKADDPVFNAHSTPEPTVEKPADQSSPAKQAVSLQLVCSGGAPKLTWSATGLPPGLSINADTGLISGTPTTANTYANIIVTVVDSISRRSDATFNWVVGTAAPSPTKPVDQGSDVGVAIAPLQLAATDGTAPFTWSATGLPDGLTMGTDGKISGTPSKTGSYPVAVTVRDAKDRTGTTTFPWVINAKPTLTAVPDQRTIYNRSVDLSPALQGGTAPVVWSASGLPGGLRIDSATGRITGTTNRTGTFTVTITATDKPDQTATDTFTWVVTLR